MKYNYLFFDVANTLLQKDNLYEVICEILMGFNIDIDENVISRNHKLISEVLISPSKPSREFYQNFNSELLFSLGIIPTEEMLNLIYNSIKSIPWHKFEDTSFLENIKIPMGIISNWDDSLEEKLRDNFEIQFSPILSSTSLGIAKPHINIFSAALSSIKLSPQQVLYIGDSLKLDIMPALKSGMDTLLIDRNNIYSHSPVKRITSLSNLLDYIA